MQEYTIIEEISDLTKFNWLNMVVYTIFDIFLSVIIFSKSESTVLQKDHFMVIFL